MYVALRVIKLGNRFDEFNVSIWRVMCHCSIEMADIAI